MKENRIVFFAFQDTVAGELLAELDYPKKFYIRSEKESIIEFVDRLSSSSMTGVVGLGEYSGRDKDKLRIETRCNNKFRNRRLLGSVSELRPFLKPLEKSKYSAGLGNSYCNLISFLFANTTKFRFTFIHVPKEFDIKTAKREIDLMIKSIVE